MNNNVVQLFPGNPLQADELYENDTNNPAVRMQPEDDAIIGLSEDDIDAIHEVEDEARVKLISTQVTNMIVQMLDASGYENPLDTDADVDMCLITEAVASLMQKYNGKAHPLQKVAERTIAVDDDDVLSYHFDWGGMDFDVTIEPEPVE